MQQENDYRIERDPLTGILNNNAFKRITHALQSAPEPLWFILIDIDALDDINQKYGRKTGDACLVRVAHLLERFAHMGDYLFRFNDDQFVALLQATGKELENRPFFLIEQVNSELKDPHRSLPACSVSAGAAFSNRGYHEDLYLHADELLCEIKRSQRGTCLAFNPNLSDGHPGSTALRKSAYPEPILYFTEPPAGGLSSLNSFIEESLRANNAVGIFCGSVKPEMPLYFASEFALSNLGYTSKTLREKCRGNYINLVWPEDRLFYEDALKNPEEITSRGFVRRTVRLVRKNGTPVVFREAFLIVQGENGNDYWVNSLRPAIEQSDTPQLPFETNTQNQKPVNLKTSYLETDIQTLVLSDLAESYHAVFTIDFENDRFRLFTNSERLRSFAGSEGSLSVSFVKAVQAFIAPEHRPFFVIFEDDEVRNQRLSTTNQLRFRYYETYHGWCSGELFVAARDEDGNPRKVVFTSRILEDSTIDPSNDENHDQLTRALNSRGLTESSQSLKGYDRPVLLGILQIDNIKQITDTFGQAVADEAIVSTYQLIKDEFPENAIIGRTCLYEFGIIVPCKTESYATRAITIAERICRELSLGREGSPSLICHVGYAVSPYGYTAQLRRLADDALRYAQTNTLTCHVYNGSENSNAHLSLRDWINIKETEGDKILSAIDGPLRDKSFFNLIDLELGTYRFLKTRDLPELAIPTEGNLVTLGEHYSKLNPNGDQAYAMTTILNQKELTKTLSHERNQAYYEFSIGSDACPLWLSLRLLVLSRTEDGAPKLVIGGLRDITNEKNNILDSRELPELLYQSAFEAVVIINKVTGLATVEKSFLPNTTKQDQPPTNYYKHLQKETLQHVAAEEREAVLSACSIPQITSELKKSSRYSVSVTYHLDQTKHAVIELHYRYLNDDKANIVLAIENVTEITELDSVTREKNLVGFIHAIDEMFDEIDPQELCVLHFNIKDFKNVNEMMGFSFGNSILRRIARALKLSLLKPLLIARDTGDKFYCLIYRDRINSDEIARLSVMDIEDEDRSLRLHLECGLYLLTGSEDIRSACDKARFAAENPAPDNVSPYSLYDASLNRNYMEKAEIAMNAATALENGEFRAFYQPIFDARTKRIASAEALVRWIHPQKGAISPDVFIPALEQRGMISRIDLQMLEQVEAFQAARLNENKYTVPISVNLSRVDLVNPRMRFELQRRVSCLTISVDLLRFEVTESAYVDATENGIGMLDKMSSEGLLVMIDDFGSGYSSLSTLAEHHFDIVKLDMSFISMIGKNDRAETIIRSSIAMSHSMGAKIVAEGVETEEQYNFLRAVECDYIQGYLFSKPISSHEFNALLDAQ